MRRKITTAKLQKQNQKTARRECKSINDPVKPVTEETAHQLIKQLEKQRKTMHDWIEAGRFFTAKKEDMQ